MTVSCRKLCVGPWDAVANHRAEQVSADNSQNTTDCGPDQPFQADAAKANLEQDDGGSQHDAHQRVNQPGQAERFQEVGGKSDYKNK